jgi:hypothetical protein
MPSGGAYAQSALMIATAAKLRKAGRDAEESDFVEKVPTSFDYLVGGGEQRLRNAQAEYPRSLEV